MITVWEQVNTMRLCNDMMFLGRYPFPTGLPDHESSRERGNMAATRQIYVDIFRCNNSPKRSAMHPESLTPLARIDPTLRRCQVPRLSTAIHGAASTWTRLSFNVLARGTLHLKSYGRLARLPRQTSVTFRHRHRRSCTCS